LLGCNSGESNNPALTQNTDSTKDLAIKGYVVDGYVKDAVVCIDRNYDTTCNASEALSATSSSGYFSLPTTKVLANELLLLGAYNGTDTATQRAFDGHMRRVVNAQTYQSDQAYIISPMTDLVATAFLDSSSKSLDILQVASKIVADGYRISEAMINGNPMADVALFAVGQDIQQTKSILEQATLKTYGSTLTTTAKKQLQTNIKKAILLQIQKNDDRIFVESGLVATLEDLIGVNINDDIATFIEVQLKNVREAIYAFNEGQRTVAQLEAFQRALETEVDKVRDMIDLHASGIPLPPFALEIDITVDIDDNTTVPDDNTTVPVDSNYASYDISGVMADGYISGANIYVDKNSNEALDSGENFVSTSVDGVFSFSDLNLSKNSFYPIVGSGGVDTATNKAFERVYRSVLATAETSVIEGRVLSPLSDMVATLFFRSSSKDSAAYTSATSLIAQKFGVDQSVVVSDPMKSKKLFINSLGLEAIKTVLERLVSSKKTLTLYGKEQIKEALLEQILASSYADFNPSRVLTTVDIRSGMVLDSEDKAFATDMIENIKTTLDALYMDTTIIEELYPRLQKLLTDALEERIGEMQYQDLNVTAQKVSYSIYNKTDAIYDPLSCSTEGEYTKRLVSLSDEAIAIEDSTNGIIIGFDSQPATGVEAIEIYYPSLGVSKQQERVVVFKDNYYFSYDKAWIDTQKSVYLRSPRREDSVSESYDCYRIKLDQEFGINAEFQKVYRYTDL